MVLTQEEKAANYETCQHINRVRSLLDQCCSELLARSENHDKTKLETPEVEVFTKHTPNLPKHKFGSKEYNDGLVDMEKALTHHYSKNRHHTQFHENGIKDMNLLDIMEMLCDWKASSERHPEGDVMESIEKCAKKFKIKPQLKRILENTVNYMVWENK